VSADSDWTSAWLGNARWSFDASTRFIHANDEPSGLYALGLDYYNVFSSARGDLGTLIFQPYLVRVDEDQAIPGLSSQKSDSGLRWRIANFNYTGVGRGRFNVRLGHLELPFGLEQIVQTNGTINQMNALANTGIKTDWGVTVNGELPNLEYEVGFLRGGGNGLRTDADGYFVGRIGLPRTRTWWLGVSGISGELEFRNSIVDLRGLAIDGGFRAYNGLHLLLEYTAQETDSQSNNHLFGELGYTSRSEALVSYFQWRSGNRSSALGGPSLPKASLGLRYEPSRWWSASMELQRLSETNLDTSLGAGRTSHSVVMQLRFRS